MKIAKTKRKFPRLVRQTEEQLGLRFPKKPMLKLSKGGRPRAHMYTDGRHEIIITERMAREDPQASESAIRHELREVLISEHLQGATQGQARGFAMAFETSQSIEDVDGYYEKRKKRER